VELHEGFGQRQLGLGADPGGPFAPAGAQRFGVVCLALVREAGRDFAREADADVDVGVGLDTGE